MTDSSSSIGSPSNDTEGTQTPIIRHYLDILRRRIWIILSITVVFSCVGAVRAFRAPNIYSSSTVIMIERQTPRIVSFDPSSPDFAPWDPDFYNTQAQLILSQSVLELAVQDPLVARTLGQYSEEKSQPLADRMKEIILAALGAPPAQIPKMWEKLAGRVTAKPKGGTHVITISATARDARTPAILADGVARAFETYMLNSRTEMLGDAFSYLKEEKEREEEKYLAAERELQEFREESKDVDLGKDASPTTTKLAALNSRLTDLQLRRAELKAQLVAIPQILESATSTPEESYSQILAIPIIKEDDSVQAARSKIEQEEARSITLSRTYGSEHPLLQESRATLAQLRNEFNETIQRTLQLQANRLEGIVAEETELTRQYDELKEVVLENAQGSFKMARLEMEVDRHRQLFDALVKRMLEVEMSSGFETTSVRRLKEAAVSHVPIGPNRRLDVIMAILMGLGLGLGLAIVIETMDDTIKTPEDLRDKLAIPLLGFVPRIQAKTADKKHQRIKTLFAVDEPVSSVAEAFRQIRTNIFYSLSTDSAKVLVSTSCHPGEGKTTTICNLAAVIAQNGRRVLLIDGDFHRPNVHHVYGIKSSVGLVDVLSGTIPWKKALCTPSRNGRLLENIHIIPAGPSTAASSERLGSAAMKAFITEARSEYDWVLVDSPPLLFVSDASVLSAMCDGIILVVKAGMNNRSLLVRTCNQLRQLKVEIMGTILNQMVVSFMGRHYSYYYYHGYAHYAENYHRSYYGDTPEEEPAPEEATPVSAPSLVAPPLTAAPEPTTPPPGITEASVALSTQNGQRRTLIGASTKGSRTRSTAVDRKKAADIQAALDRWRKATPSRPSTYHMGKGDVLEITIPALRETDQRSTVRKSIDRKGMITLPAIGDIEADGLTVSELVTRIVQLCRERHVQDSNVTVAIAEHQSAAILLLGTVVNPGIVHLPTDTSTVLEVLIQSGGLASPSGNTITIVRAVSPAKVMPTTESPAPIEYTQPTASQVIDLANLLDPEQDAQNVAINRGDIIIISSTDRPTVHVVGLVQKPGSMPILTGTPVTVCTALASAGGFTSQERTEPCHLVRHSLTNERRILEIQLPRIIYGEQQDVPMQDGDILVVGSRILTKFIQSAQPLSSSYSS